MSAQKALQGSETETRELLGGAEEKSASPTRGSLICPPGKSMIFTSHEAAWSCRGVGKKISHFCFLVHGSQVASLFVLFLNFKKKIRIKFLKSFDKM